MSTIGKQSWDAFECDRLLQTLRVVLLDTNATLTNQTSIYDLIAAEVTNYTPPQYSASYSFNTGNNTTSFASSQYVITASNGAYSYTHIGIWQGRSSVTNRVVSSIDTSTNVITTSVAHGFVNGDRIIVTSDVTVPGGVTAIRYWADVASTTTLRLATNEARTNILDIISAGSGIILLRNASGCGRIAAVTPRRTVNASGSATIVVPSFTLP